MLKPWMKLFWIWITIARPFVIIEFAQAHGVSYRDIFNDLADGMLERPASGEEKT